MTLIFHLCIKNALSCRSYWVLTIALLNKIRLSLATYLLWWDIKRNSPEVHLPIIVQAWDDKKYAWPLSPSWPQPAQPEDDSSLILLHNLNIKRWLLSLTPMQHKHIRWHLGHIPANHTSCFLIFLCSQNIAGWQFVHISAQPKHNMVTALSYSCAAKT